METMEAKGHTQGSLDDYLARLNLQGQRGVWKTNRAKLDFVFNRIGSFLKPSMAACDVGLGEGYALDKLYEAGMKTSGIDISGFAVQYLRERYLKERKDIRLRQGDIASIEMEADQFDVITCFDVLEHVLPGKVNAAIKNIKRALKCGGLLIGTLPYREVLDESMIVCPSCGHEFHVRGHHHSFQSIQDIKKMLGTGFDLVKYGDVPYCWSGSETLNQLGTAFLVALKGLTGRRSRTTIYFVARLRKQE